MKREFGGLSCWAKQEPAERKPPTADALAERLAKLATALPDHADLLRTCASMLIKQECKLALVRRAMR